MSEASQAISPMCAVTISREYGSGGGEISARLARRLGWQLIDHEIVVLLARELQISEAEAAAQDEYAESLFYRILGSLRAIPPPAPVPMVPPAMLLRSDGQAYYQALCRVVEAAAARRHVVIVGRGAQVLLGNRRDVLHIRVVAPLEARIAYVMRREELDRGAAQARIQLKERDRIRYLQAQHQRHPADPHLYDLVVNAAILDLESLVEIIVLALERKGQQLATPAEELGPAAGMARYPGQPGDFRPPASITEPKGIMPSTAADAQEGAPPGTSDT